LKDWLGLDEIQPQEWTIIDSVKAWWRDVVQKRGHSRKVMASLAMLVNWEIWKERNARVFTNKSSTSNMLILKIKEEVNL
jgi:hypothetical protein